MNKTKWRASLFSIMIIFFTMSGCAGKKVQPTDNFGTQLNFPVFNSSSDFFHSAGVVWKIMALGKYDGRDVKKPGAKDSWIGPAFREKLCLVVTINNHCMG